IGPGQELVQDRVRDVGCFASCHREPPSDPLWPPPHEIPDSPWISDRYTAQQGHAAAHQTCLAHLARDVAYVVEVSDDPVPWRL
ncbi:hypothetical protein FV242_34210, partial [Methylobacterium sp. WL64]